MLQGTWHYSKVKTCCPSQPQWNISDPSPKSTGGFGLVPWNTEGCILYGWPNRPLPGWSLQFREYNSQIPGRGFSLPVFCLVSGPIYFYMAVSESIWKSKLDYVTVLPKDLQWLHRAHKVKFELLPCPAGSCMIWTLPSLQAMRTLTHYVRSTGQPSFTVDSSRRLSRFWTASPHFQRMHAC